MHPLSDDSQSLRLIVRLSMKPTKHPSRTPHGAWVSPMNESVDMIELKHVSTCIASRSHYDFSPSHAANILPAGPPQREEDWWVTSSTKSDDTKTFRNCGFEAWKTARSEWRGSVHRSERDEAEGIIVPERSQVPSGLRRQGILRGITGNRKYELPSSMSLTYVVGVLNDHWIMDASD